MVGADRISVLAHSAGGGRSAFTVHWRFFSKVCLPGLLSEAEFLNLMQTGSSDHG